MRASTADMENRPFGSAARQVSEIGQGTWNIEREPIDTAVRALRSGIDLGMTHINTAEMYGSGKSEQVIAKAIDGRRDDIFLAWPTSPIAGG